QQDASLVNYLISFSLAFFIIAVRILINSLISFKSGSTTTWSLSLVSQINRNQYSVSLASFNEIVSPRINSFFVPAFCASSIFAPTEVPERMTWLLIAYPEADLGRRATKRTTPTENAKLLSLMSKTFFVEGSIFELYIIHCTFYISLPEVITKFISSAWMTKLTECFGFNLTNTFSS